jgi:hypothetical protein
MFSVFDPCRPQADRRSPPAAVGGSAEEAQGELNTIDGGEGTTTGIPVYKPCPTKKIWTQDTGESQGFQPKT